MGDWLNENLQILSTLGSALALYIFIRMGARKESREIKEEIKEIKAEIKSIDQRLTRMEVKMDYVEKHQDKDKIVQFIPFKATELNPIKEE